MSDARAVVAGRYRLEGRIAAGGMGEVWKGTDVVLGLPVAVKLLRAGYAQDPGSLARFRSEARHAASLSHPGIAQVYDYGQAEPPYLVMELVDGPSLAQVLGGGPLDPGRAMDVVAQAAAGLDAAHRAGLVHRDVKPGNLLLGPGGRVKITDFGICRAAGSATVTGTGELLGTPAYLAPERLAGQVATPASDLYSLGVLGWECLAGTPPFTGAPVEVALAHRNRPLPPLPAAVPADVAALVGELTARDPLARPRGAGEVASRAGLRDALNSGAALTLEAQPDPLADPVRAAPARPGTRVLPAAAGWVRPVLPQCHQVPTTRGRNRRLADSAPPQAAGPPLWLESVSEVTAPSQPSISVRPDGEADTVAAARSGPHSNVNFSDASDIGAVSVGETTDSPVTAGPRLPASVICCRRHSLPSNHTSRMLPLASR